MSKRKTMTAQEVEEIVKEALDNVKSNPCTICARKSVCKLTYKGVCKVARQLRSIFIKTDRSIYGRKKNER